jgi:hypothetical protein
MVPQMTAPPAQRKLALSDILEAGAGLVVRNLAVFLRISAPLIVPVNLVFVALVLALGPDFVPKRYDRHFAFLYLPWLVVLLLASLLAGGACLRAAAALRAGTAAGARDSFSHLRRRLGPYAGVAAAMVAAIGPGVLLYLAVGQRPLGNLGYLVFVLIPLSLWLGGIWSVAPPVVIAEELGPVASLERSRRLAQGAFWHSLATVLFGSILALFVCVVGILLGSVFSLGGDSVRVSVLVLGATVGELLAVPLLSAYLVLIYDDLRFRRQIAEAAGGAG